MSMSGKTIAKNVGVMMASQLITWVLAFVLAIFLPRYLGATAVGVISIANSIWLIMSVILAFGMDIHLTKSISRDPARTSELLSTSLVLRLIFFVLSALLVSLYLYGLHYAGEVVIVTYIIGFSFLFYSFTAAITAALIGLERMEYVSLANIVSKGVLTGITLLMIFFGYGIFAIAAVYVISSFASCAILFFSLTRYYPLHFRFRLADARAMLAASSTYLVAGLTLVVYQEIDKLFIASLVDTQTVGWYSTAMNLFGTLMFVPVVFATVVFPAMARSYAAGEDKVNIIARRSFNLMFLLSIPVGLGIVVIAQPLILLLYGAAFAPSGAILAMLGMVLVFTYLNTLLGQLLISTDRTSKWNIVMLVAIAVTLPLDLVLVPWTNAQYGNGALGGAIAFLFTEFGMVVAAILLLPKGTLHWSNVRTAALALLAGLIMVGASWWWRDSNMLLSIGIGALTYTAAIALMRVVPGEDVALIKEASQQILARLRRNKGATAGIGN